MFASDDPSDMKPEERFQEIAAILARGFLRLPKTSRRYKKSFPESVNLLEMIEENSAEFADNRLDSFAKESVHTAVVNKFRE